MPALVPIEANEVVTVTISGQGSRGDWLGNYAGVVIFISDLHPNRFRLGDTLKLKVTYVGERFCRGVVIDA